MGGYYDDNFGHWDGMDPNDPDYEDNVAFYKKVQDESVWKVCKRCLQKVKLRPDYGICNACCELEERGFQF